MNTRCELDSEFPPTTIDLWLPSTSTATAGQRAHVERQTLRVTTVCARVRSHTHCTHHDAAYLKLSPIPSSSVSNWALSAPTPTTDSRMQDDRRRRPTTGRMVACTVLPLSHAWDCGHSPNVDVYVDAYAPCGCTCVLQELHSAGAYFCCCLTRKRRSN